MELGKIMKEISGITYNYDDNNVLAVSDSKRNVFDINFAKPKLKDYTDKIVPEDSDLEDIVKVKDTVYILASNGTIFQAWKDAKDTSGITSYKLPLNGKNDFETVYYDPTVNGLILLCKSCAYEKGQQRKSAFRFDLETKAFDTSAFFRINTKEVQTLLKDDAEFDPSAAAIHPVDKRLYILSSAGNLLVVTDTRGKVIEAYHLNPDTFPQAEGIAFAPNGDMLITNEGKYGNATLLIFPYKNRQKK